MRERIHIYLKTVFIDTLTPPTAVFVAIVMVNRNGRLPVQK